MKKMQFFWCIVMSVLVYSEETWAAYAGRNQPLLFPEELLAVHMWHAFA